MDLVTWNRRNSCCCPKATCDAGTIKCESRSFTSTCADDDYTDAVRVWEDTRDIWVNEPITEWQADLAAWLAADPDRVAKDYPVPQPDPRDPNDYTVDPPDKPAGYDDVTHGCYGPYAQPSGLPTDPIPLIYRTYDLDLSHFDWIDGEGYAYESFWLTEGGTESIENWSKVVYVNNIATIQTSEQNYDTLTECTNTVGEFLGYINPDLVPFGDEVPTCELLPASRTYSLTATSTQGEIPLEMQGCPGPFPEGPNSQEAWDFTRTTQIIDLLASPISKDDLIARSASNIPTGWPDEPEGTLCSAKGSADWPLIGDFMIPGDPDADPPTDARWPTCDELSDGPQTTSAQGTSNKWRYKMGVPLKYQAHRLWEIAHAEWLACEADTPGECGPEPVEPQIFHYFAKQWDVVKFWKVWENWRIRWDAWVLATAAHEQWVIDKAAWDACELTTPGECGPEPEEPTVPADPTDDQPAERPEFIDENLTWTWTGGETEALQYETDWHEYDAPTGEWEIRIVNQQEWCYQSEKGVPPTYRGEIYNPDDYPT